LKRLKSVLDLDELRVKQGRLMGEVWLCGKLLYAWVIEHCLGSSGGKDWNRLDQSRRTTGWRFLKIIRNQVDAWILEVHRWRKDRWPLASLVLQERPRRRTLQTLPDRVIQLLEACRKIGWCAT
jgi:hypothetical protein